MWFASGPDVVQTWLKSGCSAGDGSNVVQPSFKRGSTRVVMGWTLAQKWFNSARTMAPKFFKSVTEVIQMWCTSVSKVATARAAA
eukprot:4225288-Pyramimonas_sp.AAC.1